MFVEMDNVTDIGEGGGALSSGFSMLANPATAPETSPERDVAVVTPSTMRHPQQGQAVPQGSGYSPINKLS